MDLISKLPNEILMKIIPHVPIYPIEFGGITACCLVNRRFHAIASRILYNHITLKYSCKTGFDPRMVETFLAPNHSSIHHVRKISVQWADTTRPIPYTVSYNPKFPLKDAVAEEMAVVLERLVERLGGSRLEFIEVERFEILKYLSPETKLKVKAVELFVASTPGSDYMDFGVAEINEYYGFLSNLEKCTQGISHLESIKITNLGSFFENFETAWQVCQQNRLGLKSLRLFGSDRIFHTNINGSIQDMESLLERSNRLEALEELYFTHFSNLWCLTNFEQVYNPATIKKFGLTSCSSLSRFAMPWVPSMENLIDLNLVDYGGLVDVEELLLNLPRGLVSLQLSHSETPVDGHPSKRALRRHSQTLRKLWLEFLEDYVKYYEIPFDTGEDNDLDVKTISEFPVLEYLGAVISLPPTWNSLAPSFPSLRYLYLINAEQPRAHLQSKSVQTLKERILKMAQFMQGWLHWLESPYQGSGSQGLKRIESKIRIVSGAIHPWPYHEPQVLEPAPFVWEYRAFFRRSSAPFSFDLTPREPSFVRRWDPEAWEFFGTGIYAQA
ncbi:hypothetical protein TWF281_000029 [Arthrobotrys megalospora]